MGDLQSFLNANPSLLSNNSGIIDGGRELSISAIVTQVSEDHVEISHQGVLFSVNPSDIVDIQQTKSSENEQVITAIIKLRGDAVLVAVNAVPVQQFTSGLPFGFRSQGAMTSMTVSPAEEAWRARMGYPAMSEQQPQTTADMAAAMFSRSTCYWCYSDRNCGWIYDRTDP